MPTRPQSGAGRPGACCAKGWRAEVFRDLGRGMNDRKQGGPRLLGLILRRPMRRLILTHQGRLRRFGTKWVVALCEWQDIELVVSRLQAWPAGGLGPLSGRGSRRGPSQSSARSHSSASTSWSQGHPRVPPVVFRADSHLDGSHLRLCTAIVPSLAAAVPLLSNRLSINEYESN